MNQTTFSPIIIFALNTANDHLILEGLGHTYKTVTGVYKGVKESAYVVSYNALPKVLELAQRYNQESILISGKDRDSHLLFPHTGSTVHLGTLQRVESVKGIDSYTIDENSEVWACKK